MTEQITLLLVDDHAMLRGMLEKRLQAEPDLMVIDQASSADEAVASAERHQPLIILMDIDMPGMSCFAAAKKIQQLSPNSRIIYLSAFFHDRYISQALAVEAWGFITKSEPEDTVINGIRNVAQGISYFSPEAQSRIIVDESGARLVQEANSCTEARCRAESLSERELEVLRYVARALSKKEIALAMNISVNTVNRHTTSVMNKLDLHDRVELALYAIREGLAEA